MMWWRAGFPNRVPSAPWHRCISTGNYALVIDTDSLTIPHIGKNTGGPLSDLPTARLELKLTVNGKVYRANKSKKPSRFTGPRIIESGNFLQRSDVTDLIFKADDGTVLNQESRLETAAWGDRLSLILSARPGLKPIVAGDQSFGKWKGGFGLTGQNRLDIPADEAGASEHFTLSFWVFPPIDFQAGRASPWLVCKNHHEQKLGNFGITVNRDGILTATINSGGPGNSHQCEGASWSALKREKWNHVAISFDGTTLRLFVNRNFCGGIEGG